jgi:predicted RNA-binding protein with PUA-like domain
MQYWLVKSEPDEFSLTDLQRKGTEPWTGVRNYQARNFMRDGMKPGDLVLFYHSSITPPEIVGLATVSSKAYPDPTQFDLKGEYFEPRATPENPVWFLVNLTYKETFPKSLNLNDIKADPLLSTMRVAQRGSRLSVQPVEEKHFKRVLELVKN